MIDTIFIESMNQAHDIPIKLPEENQNQFLKELLKEYLLHNKCKIIFTKADGSNRIMIASLLSKYVEPIKPVEKTIEEGVIPKEPKPDNPNLLVLVDTEINAWRSVKIDSITRFELLWIKNA